MIWQIWLIIDGSKTELPDLEIFDLCFEGLEEMYFCLKGINGDVGIAFVGVSYAGGDSLANFKILSEGRSRSIFFVDDGSFAVFQTVGF
jgi:hypothetical protein